MIGAAVSAALVLQLADGPLVVRDAGRYLDYDAGLVYGGEPAALYVAATCGPALLSSIRRVQLFGVLRRQKVYQLLDQELRKDRSPSKAVQVSDFGLIIVTRKRVKQSLERLLTEPCPYCSGTGVIKASW